MTRPKLTKGTGNVFRDLGFSKQKSAELILKSSLLQALQETIMERGWKQVEAAGRLSIDQAKVSKLLAGQMAGFSVEPRPFPFPCWARMWKKRNRGQTRFLAESLSTVTAPDNSSPSPHGQTLKTG